MGTVLHIALSNAVAAAVLALVAGAAGRVCRRRPAVVHGLWLLVLVKLLTPPLVDVPVPWPAPPPPAADAALPMPLDLAPAEPLVAGAVPVGGDAAEPVVAPVVAADVVPDSPEVAPAGAPAWSWERVLCGAWLAGSLGWFLLAGVRVARFGRLLRHGSPAPAALRERVSSLARGVGLRRCPEVLLLPGRLAPLVWAFAGPPRLCLPAGLLEEVEGAALDTLLVHELAHLRRRDHWVRRLEFVVLGLYWWHPVAWYARRELREAEEQCCDAWVVAVLPGSGRTYAAALVDTLDFLSTDPAVLPLEASGLGRVADLKRRLTMILRGKTPRGLGRGGLLAVLGLGALLPLWPRLAQAEPAREEEPPARTEAPEVRKAQDELQVLKAQMDEKNAELKLKMAELELLKARVAQAQADEARLAAAKAGHKEEKKIVIRVEIDGTEKGDEVKKLVSKIQDAVDGKARIELSVRPVRVNALPPPGYPPTTSYIPVAPGTPAMPYAPGTVAAPPRPRDDVERRLEELQRELEALRREVHRSRTPPTVAPAPGIRPVEPRTPTPAPPAPKNPFGG